MSSIKCVIIDDDPFIQELLKDKLSLYVPEVEILATASSGEEGIAKIKQYQPDLIFQDVEMADMTGFQMLAKLEEINFQTIFITSFSHYAIKAIRFNALDYLMKPIDLAELKAAIARYRKNAETNSGSANVQQALKNFKTSEVANQVFTLQTQDGEMRLMLKNIVRIKADRNYSTIYLADNRKKVASKTLSDMEELLDEKGFFRCHKSHLIHGMHIQAVPNSFFVHMSDGSEVPIARRKKDDFKQWNQERQAPNS